MRIILTGSLLLATCGCLQAGRTGSFHRGFICQNSDAKIELYVPTEVALADDPVAALAKPVDGYYALDITSAGKGKILKPVKVGATATRDGIVIDQHTRGLPPTTVPIVGGTVSFDQRFAADVSCRPFLDDGELE